MPSRRLALATLTLFAWSGCASTDNQVASPPHSASAIAGAPETKLSQGERALKPSADKANQIDVAPASFAETLEPAPIAQAVEPVEFSEQALGSTPPENVQSVSLAAILQQAESQNPNLSFARERINEAYARVDRADALWVPSLRAGINFNHHEGAIQDVAGVVFNTSRGSIYGGLGAGAVGAGSPAVPGLVAQFHLTDAIFQPRIAEHQAASRQFGATAVRNDILRDASVAYLELVRAEHALAIASEAQEHTNKLADITEKYAGAGQGLESDRERMQAELALRDGQLAARQETVLTSSAQLAQILHASPTILLTSDEPAVEPLELMTADGPIEGLVSLGLSRRPELCEQRHLVSEAFERLNRESYAPLIPSVLLGMSYGGLGGGLGGAITNTDDRLDVDAMAYWELRNVGLGDRAAQREMSSAARQAQFREVAILDRIAREVAEAHAKVTKRKQRIEIAKKGILAAEKSYSLNLKRIENAQGLPIETLQAIQALASAQQNYLDAVIDYNIAQVELCRATGWTIEPPSVSQ
jgi:outer membrane protein TolC